MHIYLAWDRFPAPGLLLHSLEKTKQIKKEKEIFSLKWKKFYLLWAQGQDAIELMPTIDYFNLCCP